MCTFELGLRPYKARYQWNLNGSLLAVFFENAVRIGMNT